MKAIFLDIDGVLNNGISSGVMHSNSTNPVCIEKLNEIITFTQAKVFIISSWVDDFYFIGKNKKLADFLYSRGVLFDSIVGFRKDGLDKEQGIIELVQQNENIE